MRGKTIAILETRTGAHLGDLVARRGGMPLLAPALNEVPDMAPDAVTSLLGAWRTQAYGMVIFQTGVGTRALFQATDALGHTDELCELLSRAVVVIRGPKPAGELDARRVRIDLRAGSPFTTETVIEAIAHVSLDETHVLVQRYGATNDPLRIALQARGATVGEIATYRWAVPDDTGPLEALLDALEAGRVDAIVFTSAVQIHNLFAVAERSGRAHGLADQMKGRVVASIGPVCSRALLGHGISPTFEADPPKLGPLMAALDVALSER